MVAKPAPKILAPATVATAKLAPDAIPRDWTVLRAICGAKPLRMEADKRPEPWFTDGRRVLLRRELGRREVAIKHISIMH